MIGPALAWASLTWTWGAPPPPRARLLLLDSLGCALAGLGHPRPRGLAMALAASMPGAVALPGCMALAPAGAAAVLATAMCWDEANEGLARAHGRPGLATAPLALAAIASGAEVDAALAAFATGYEVAARAGEIFRIRPGMHVDGTWHSLGAAVTAVRLAGGDQGAAGRAMRLAACQIPFSLYAPIAAGMDGRNSYPAHAVLLGQLCAASAMAGMDAPDEGFATACRLALGIDTPAAATPPGEWLLEQAYTKRFAGVRHAHYGAAAALALRDDIDAPIDTIALHTYPEALHYAATRAPATAIAAQFSLSWAVAAALLQGDLGPAAYTGAALADPALRRLESLVTLHEDPAPGRFARLVLTLGDGRGLEHTARDVPMTDADVLDKFLGFARPSLGRDGAEAAADTLLRGHGIARGLFTASAG